MKLLLLSCATGEGHNSAAYAIAQELERQNIDYELKDPVGFKSDRAKRLVADVYNNMIKNNPSAFNFIYKVGALYSSTGITSPVYLANAVYAEKLLEYITENGFDRVICTHLYGMEAMTAIERKTGHKIPTYGVLTDYTCIPFFEETQLEGYFAPHSDIIPELIQKQLPPERIYAAGIPVSAKFSENISRSAARSALGLSEDKNILLIMSGGVGCGSVLELCEEFEKSSADCLACVLVGKNESLKAKIDERFGGNPNISTVPFTRDVNLYMRAADAMISKAGGLTSTEAAVSNIALVHLLAYSACEAKNVEFFTKKGMSVQANNPSEAVRYALNLIEDKEKSERMRKAQRENTNPLAAAEIVAKVLE